MSFLSSRINYKCHSNKRINWKKKPLCSGEENKIWILIYNQYYNSVHLSFYHMLFHIIDLDFLTPVINIKIMKEVHIYQYWIKNRNYMAIIIFSNLKSVLIIIYDFFKRFHVAFVMKKIFMSLDNKHFKKMEKFSFIIKLREVNFIFLIQLKHN